MTCLREDVTVNFATLSSCPSLGPALLAKVYCIILFHRVCTQDIRLEM